MPPIFVGTKYGRDSANNLSGSNTKVDWDAQYFINILIPSLKNSLEIKSGKLWEGISGELEENSEATSLV